MPHLIAHHSPQKITKSDPQPLSFFHSLFLQTKFKKMDYGKLGPSDPGGSTRSDVALVNRRATTASGTTKKKLIILFSLLAVVLVVASVISAAVLTAVRPRAGASSLRAKPTQAISNTCSKTRFPTLCVKSLLDFPGSTAASERDLVHISLNMTFQHLARALYSSAAISAAMEPRVRAAYDDCLELLDDSVDSLARSISSFAAGSQSSDVLTWLSAALTNQDTCAEGFADTAGEVKDQMTNNLKDLSELVSNCLAIFSGAGAGDDFSGVPIQNRRRLLAMRDDGNFPRWLNRRDRKLLSLPVSAMQANVVVSKDGNGTVKTIAEAIKKVPEGNSRRFIIYVRAGR